MFSITAFGFTATLPFPSPQAPISQLVRSAAPEKINAATLVLVTLPEADNPLLGVTDGTLNHARYINNTLLLTRYGDG